MGSAYLTLQEHILLYQNVRNALEEFEALEKVNKLPNKKYKVVHREWLEEYLSSFKICK